MILRPNGDGDFIGIDNPIQSGDSNYGVNLDSGTMTFSGQAWSENIGWISFDPADLVGCPSGTCVAGLTGSRTTYGWARALAPIGQPLSITGGWDGWIKLGGTAQAGGDYNGFLDVAPDPSELSGGFFGEDDSDGEAVVGWVSLNHSNCDADEYGQSDG